MRTLRDALGLVLAALALAPASSVAAKLPLAWDLPTAYEGGSPLAAPEVTQTRIEYGTCGAGGSFGEKRGEFVVPGAATTATSPDLAPGTWCFRAYPTADGLEGAASDVLQLVVPAAAPRAIAVVPGMNLAPLYRIGANGARGEAVLGFIPVGSDCGGPVVFTYRGVPYRRPLDWSLARWWATTPTTSAAAPCR